MNWTVDYRCQKSMLVCQVPFSVKLSSWIVCQVGTMRRSLCCVENCLDDEAFYWILNFKYSIINTTNHIVFYIINHWTIISCIYLMKKEDLRKIKELDMAEMEIKSDLEMWWTYCTKQCFIGVKICSHIVLRYVHKK